METNKDAFPGYTFCKQKWYLCERLVKPRSMKIRSFISRLQELNTYFVEFPPNAEGQETKLLPADKNYESCLLFHAHHMENKMIEQALNYADSTVKEMTDFFETRVENLEHEVDKNKSSSSKIKAKKTNNSRNRKEQTPTQVLYSQVKNLLSNIGQTRSTAFCTENAVILHAIARIYVL